MAVEVVTKAAPRAAARHPTPILLFYVRQAGSAGTIS